MQEVDSLNLCIKIRDDAIEKHKEAIEIYKEKCEKLLARAEAAEARAEKAENERDSLRATLRQLTEYGQKGV